MPTPIAIPVLRLVATLLVTGWLSSNCLAAGEAKASPAAASPDEPRWTPFGRPPDGQNNEVVVRTLAIDPHRPDNLWIGLDGEGHRHHGIFRAARPDASWQRVHAGQHYDSWSIAFARSDAAAIYAASDSHSTIRSVDGGANWMELSAPDQVEGIAVDPTNSRVVYLVRAHGWGGSKTTTAGGGSWENFVPHNSMTCIAVAPQDPAIIYVGSRYYDGKERAGIFRSTDGGTTWTKVFEEDQILTIAIDPQDSHQVYAGTLDRGLYRSRDGGATWHPASQGITLPSIGALAIDPTNPRIVYAGTRGDGVFRSDDGGDTWQPMNRGLTQLRITALAVHPKDSSKIYVGTTAGVYGWGQPGDAVVAGAVVPPGVLGELEPVDRQAPPPRDLLRDTEAERDRIWAAARAAQARERRGKMISAFVLIAIVISLVAIFVYRSRPRVPAAGLAESELRACTRPAVIAGFVFTGIYILAGLFFLQDRRTHNASILTAWALVDAALFLTGSLLALGGRTTPARIVWIIAGIAGFPLGMVMVGFANLMNTRLKAAQERMKAVPPVLQPAGPGRT